MDEFLKMEYDKCLDLLKYYDDRHQALIKFSATLSSAIPPLLLFVYKIDNGYIDERFWLFVTFICTMTALSQLILFATLIQVRLYFIYPARQVNAIRRFALSKVSEFTDNQMYLDTNFGAFKWSSSHTLASALVALQIGLFAGVAFFSLSISVCKDLQWLIISSCVFAAMTAIVVFSVSASYLVSRSKHHPDISIHKARSA